MIEDFAALYADHRDGVWTLIRRRVSRVDHAVIDDLTSDVFERAWRARGTYRDHGSGARNWLLMIASNVAFDYLRRLRRVAWVGLEEWSAATADAGSERHVAMLDVAAAMATLSTQQRQLVDGHYRRGLSQHAALGYRSSGGSSSRCHIEALAVLRERLEVS